MKHSNKSPFKWAKRVNYYVVIDELIMTEGNWDDNRSHIFKHRRDARVFAKQMSAETGRKMEIRTDHANVPVR